ncbi:telomere length regulation protein-domain-containing protein, partial [Dipodascopsis uninucleata]
MSMTAKPFENELKILKNRPDINTIHSTIAKLSLNGIITIPSASVGDILNYIANSTLLEIYENLDEIKGLKRDLVTLFRSLAGIRALISSLSLLSTKQKLQSKSDHVEKSKTLILLDILSNVLNPGILCVLYSQIKNDKKCEFYWQDICSMFLGGKIMTSVCETVMLLKVDVHSRINWYWLYDSREYASFIGKEIAKALSQNLDSSLIAKFLKRALTIANLDQVLPHLIDKESFESLAVLLDKSIGIDFFQFYSSLIHYCQITFLAEAFDSQAASKHVAGAAFIFYRIFPEDQKQRILKLQLQYSSNVLMRRAFVVWIVEIGWQKEAFNIILRQWGDPILIRNAQITRQEVMTEILLLLIPHLSTEQIHDVASGPDFLNGISERLQAITPAVRYMGMYLANAISERDSNRPIFDGIPDFQDIYDEIKKRLAHHDHISDSGSFWDDLNFLTRETISLQKVRESESKSEVTDTGDVNSESHIYPSKVNFAESDSDDEFEPYAIMDDGSEDSDDDPTLKREKILPPLYILDMISYLQETEADKGAVMKHKMALTKGATLILKKASYGSELESNAEELATILIGLKNNFGLVDFEKMKLRSMIALVFSVPNLIGPFFSRSLAYGDYSLQEQLMLLSALALGAVYLSGSRENAEIPLDEPYFASKRLPSHIESRFMAVEYPYEIKSSGLSEVDHQIKEVQKTALSITAEKAINEVSKEPKILRVSRRLQIQREKIHNGENKNKLAKIAGSHFFFPLATHWKLFAARMNGNPFGPITISHYVKTLSIILRFSYPSSPDILDMAAELFGMIMMLQRDATETSIMEAYLTATMIITEVIEPETLVRMFPRQILQVKEDLSMTWESLVDKRIHDMAAGVLLRLSELVNKYQILLIGGYL